jgi:hypothetical protein
MLLVACGDSQPATPEASQSSSGELPIPSISLIPAEETSTPEVVPSIESVPNVGLPEGSPSDAPEPPSEYVVGADDIDAFVAAYRDAFGTSLSDAELDLVGSHLCTYLIRHADQQGNVTLADALTEADINEPGFARSDWLISFEIANAYYCSEFTVDFSDLGGSSPP